MGKPIKVKTLKEAKAYKAKTELTKVVSILQNIDYRLGDISEHLKSIVNLLYLHPPGGKNLIGLVRKYSKDESEVKEK